MMYQQMAEIQSLATDANASAVFLPGYPVNELQLRSFNAQVLHVYLCILIFVLSNMPIDIYSFVK